MDTQQLPPRPAPPADVGPAYGAGPGVRIEAEGLVQKVHGGHRTLRNVSLPAEPGGLVAIIGSSGAGNTTLLDALAGARPPAGLARKSRRCRPVRVRSDV
jgi:ABC-type transport system involved in cytochrome bd biosynthesis fused ATPase/permease subunit